MRSEGCSNWNINCLGLLNLSKHFIDVLVTVPNASHAPVLAHKRVTELIFALKDPKMRSKTIKHAIEIYWGLSAV